MTKSIQGESYLKFEFEDGRVECRRQIGGRRFHLRWPTRDAMERDLEAFLRLRELNIDLPMIVEHFAAGKDFSSIKNLGPKGPIGFLDFCDRFYAPHRQKLPSWKNERNRLDFMKREVPFRNRELHTIGRLEIQGWCDAYCHRPTVTSDNTRGHMIKLARTIFKVATRLGFLNENPARDIHIPAVPETSARSFTYQEAHRLYTKADPILRPWMLTALYTGLRPNEIGRRQVAHVDLAAHTLTASGSTRKSRPRILYIHDDLFSDMDVLASSVPNKPLMRDEHDNPVPFPRAAWDRARKAADVHDAKFYYFRHTFRTWLFQTGTTNPEMIDYLMGHKPRGVSARYFHPALSDIKAAIEKLPSVTKPSTPDVASNAQSNIG